MRPIEPRQERTSEGTSINVRRVDGPKETANLDSSEMTSSNEHHSPPCARIEETSSQGPSTDKRPNVGLSNRFEIMEARPGPGLPFFTPKTK